MDLILRDEIVQKIKSAFEKTPYPGDDMIFAHERTDEYIGKHWKQLSLNFIVRHRDDLPLLNIESFHFYLPAFLLQSLLYPEEVDTLISNLIYNLAPPEFIDGSDPSAYDYKMKQFEIRVDIFSPQEKDAITMFFQAFKQLYPNESWSILGSERERLNRAIKFWAAL